ncbi:MAG: GNAT family N-acetyltransferase [Kofleriaceae bacterium]|nr:MAG: GNAT family N-acetyltransferase [Kofleriaceae bacterium]MBZ0237180.1 GNAT family N-acetyltransferase [Kofleriaceae bacterium]
MGGTDEGLSEVTAVIRTARLVLRAPAPEDAAAIYATYASDPEATRFMGWPRHEKVSTTEWFVSMSAHEWRSYGTGTYLVFVGDTLVGSTGLHVDTKTPGEVATGYILGKAHWGHGYATEACRAMVELARARGDHRIGAYCHADHAASARVLEKSGLGFQGIRPRYVVFPNLGPELADVRVYALDL